MPSGDTTAAYFALAGALGGAGLTLIGVLLTSRGENRRLRQQLAHERHLSDRAELRTLLDETAAMTWEVAVAESMFYGAIDSLATRVAQDEILRNDETKRRAGIQEAIPKLSELREDVFRQAWALENQLARIVLRLGVKHPVAAKLRVLRDGAHQAAKIDPADDDFTVFIKDRERYLKTVSRRKGDERGDFLDACHELLRVDLESEFFSQP